MNIAMVGRQIEITPALRDFTSEKLRKLEKLLDGPLEVHVVLTVEKHRHMAEIQVKHRSHVFTGATETADLYASISEVADKLERQAQRHKEKVTERKRRGGTRAADAAVALESEAASEDDGATEQDGPTRIVTESRYRLKPLSPEDAVLELEATGETLLVFRDASTYRVNVVFRRDDGNYGLVDPEF